MKRKILIAAAAAASAVSAFYLFRCAGTGMNSAEVIRKLSGMRIAVTMFRLAKGRQPADMEELIKNGNLEAVPEIKLKRHFRSSKVRNAADPAVRDTGGWGYVNDPVSPAFGTVFIDCAHKDEKGRSWSDF